MTALCVAARQRTANGHERGDAPVCPRVRDHLRHPADQLAVSLLALFNGLAIEQLLDEERVPLELFGRPLAALVEA